MRNVGMELHGASGAVLVHRIAGQARGIVWVFAVAAGHRPAASWFVAFTAEHFSFRQMLKIAIRDVGFRFRVSRGRYGP